jgi:hypothetical protein
LNADSRTQNTRKQRRKREKDMKNQMVYFSSKKSND